MTTTSRSATIVVVNKNDDRVAATLESLARPGCAEGVAVIVVDASRGRLNFIAASHPDVRWIDFEQPSPRARTIAQQRNVGVREAQSDVIVFLDANCVPQDGWLDALLEPIESGREQIVVGAVRSAGASSLHDASAPHDLSPTGYLSEFSTLNVAIARAAFDLVGVFDEQLGFAEDVDFAWRAHDAGIAIKYAPNAVVSHDWGSTSEDIQRAFRYGVARVRLIRKHPRRWRNLLGVDLACTVYALFLLGLPITLIAPWYPFVLVIPLARSRRSHPVATVLYQLGYSAGALSELFHVPVLAAQRRS